MLRRATRVASATAGVCLAASAAPPIAGQDTTSALTNGHPYRHCVVPMQPGTHGLGPNVAATSANNLTFGGGVSGVGVTTGAPRVYLVFWGSQWGTQSTNGQGYATFASDPQAIAPVLQGFFKGLGTGSEQWSGVMTQYCEGVATGSQTCPAGSQRTSATRPAARWPGCGRTRPRRRRPRPPATRSASRRSPLPDTSATPPQPPIAARST